ncbi:MAG: T9SS type A sorting domain-containing protein [Bacteroidota bacterium]
MLKLYPTVLKNCNLSFYLRKCSPLLVAAFLLLPGGFLFAQKPSIASSNGRLVRSVERLTDVIHVNPLGDKLAVIRDINGLVGFNKKVPIPDTMYDAVADRDGAIDRHPLLNTATAAAATIGVNRDGLASAGISPGDPCLAAGPNHVVQMVNVSGGSSIRIFDKAGNIVVNNILMSNITGIQGVGDPIVLYDQLANRWLVTEFGRTNGVTTYVNTLVISVSATPDPTGAWKTYSFADDAFFVDFPKFAIWNNAYYGTSNDFNTAGNSYLGSSIYAFDRTAMLNSAPTAAVVRVRFNKNGSGYASLAPVTLEGNTLPPAGTNGLFMYFQDDAFTTTAGDADSLMIFQLTPNFTTPASSVISPETRMLCAPLDRLLCTASRGVCITQKGSGIQLESLVNKLSNKIVYRNFGTHESIVCNTTVDVGEGRGGIRWWETRRTGGNAGTWSIYQEATEAGAELDVENRWLGTINMDVLGNIALAYNVSSVNTFPSIRFMARNACDPLNTMTLAETTIIEGTAAHTISSRYGDYNALVMDPSTQRDFWLTAQYNNGASWNTRISSFKLNNCTNIPRIRFDSATIVTREASLTAGAGCQKYKDISFKISVDVAPSQLATINFSLGAGTATNNADFALLSASTTLDAANLSRTITLRVFDDAEIESLEDLQINYNIVTAGNAVADSYNQTCKIFIEDNELQPDDDNNVNIPVYSTNGTLAIGSPFQSTFTDKKIQYLYTAAALTAAGVKPGNISAVGVIITTKGSTAPFNNFNVAIGTTALTTLAAGPFNTGLVNKYSNPSYSTVGGLNNFTLNGGFNWNGTSNIIVEFCYDNTANNGSDDIIQGFSNAGGTPCIYARTNLVANENGCSFTNTTGTATNVAVLSVTQVINNTAVESQVGHQLITDVRPATNNIFYSANDGQLVASLNNASAALGCVTAKIDAEGTVWQSLYNTLRSQKVIEVTPTTNSNATYSITLYYTNAELAGMAPASLNIVKTNAASASAATVANSVSVVPTVTDYGSYKGFTATFSGFSRFFLAQSNLALPVSWLSFSAVKDRNDAILKWATAAEHNNSKYEIQTSRNGTDFVTLGTVASKGNGTNRQDYSFIHPRPEAGINYYRVKQVDKDGNNSYSHIASLNFDGKGNIKPFVYPSPAKGYITLNFGVARKGVKWQIYNIENRLVQNGIASGLQLQQQIDVSRLSPGSYVVKMYIDGKEEIARFIKE